MVQFLNDAEVQANACKAVLVILDNVGREIGQEIAGEMLEEGIVRIVAEGIRIHENVPKLQQTAHITIAILVNVGASPERVSKLRHEGVILNILRGMEKFPKLKNSDPRFKPVPSLPQRPLSWSLSSLPSSCPLALCLSPP